MRDVVIIGGGLSGLSAAYELEELKIPYRIIEVKKRLGGSIVTEQRGGFTMDGGVFAFPTSDNLDFLNEIGLADAICPAHDGHDRMYWESEFSQRQSQWSAFKGGTQVLIDTLAQKCSGAILHKMAVSSVGELNGRFTVCLENGLMLDTAALIVAAPARYVERMFRTIQPEISARLFNYGYDTITRLSLGFRRDDITLPPSLPWDMAVPFYWWTDDPQRVPEGHILLHVGVRTSSPFAASEAIVAALHEHLKTNGQPVLSHLHYWPEADPLPPHMRDFRQQMTALQNLLPQGVALIGSDYNGLSLAARFNAGREAARSIAHWLKS